MGEGFVGATVFWGREAREVVRRGLAGGMLGLEVDLNAGPDCLGRDKAAAATLDLRVDGPFDGSDFILAGAVSASIVAMVFLYCSSAAFLASAVSLHISVGHSG